MSLRLTGPDSPHFCGRGARETAGTLDRNHGAVVRFPHPEDLPAIYGGVDLVWSADCNELDANSKWLLTNGIYEAGYFGKPVIGLAGTAIGEFLAETQSG